MKKLFSFMAMALFVVGCQPYDDTALTNEVNDIKARVSALEQTCTTLNSNAAALQKSVDALEKLYTVKEVKNITGGYTIVFSNGNEISIMNGAKGDPGKDGASIKGDKGDKGDTFKYEDLTDAQKAELKGTPGKDGVTPQIGVKQSAGVWYWTVNGEWLTKDDGTKIPAEATAEAAVIPQFKVVDGYWYVKTGESDWQLIEGSKAEGSAITVTQDEQNVYITADGSTVTIPLSGFAFNASSTEVTIKPGATVEVPYTFRGGDATTRIKVESKGVTASVVKTDETSGVVTITAPADMTKDGEVYVSAVKNATSEMCAQYITVKVEIVAALSVASVTFAPDEELSTTVHLTCSGPWSAASDNEAFSVSPASGEGEADVTITASVNATTEKRAGFVSFMVGDEILNLAVSQAKALPTVDFDGCDYKSVDFIRLSTTPANRNRFNIEIVDDDPNSFKITYNGPDGNNGWIMSEPMQTGFTGSTCILTFEVKCELKTGFRLYFCPASGFVTSNRGDFGNIQTTGDGYSVWEWDLSSYITPWYLGSVGSFFRMDLLNWVTPGAEFYIRNIHFREVKEGDVNGVH